MVIFIRKAVLKFWCVILIVAGFVFGAAGADLQCADSQIKKVIQNYNIDAQKTLALDFWYDIQSALYGLVKVLKK